MKTTGEANPPEAVSPSMSPDHLIPIKIKTILVPLDFSRASMEALDYAVAFATQFQAAIHLVHVHPADELLSAPGAGHLLLQSAEAIERLNEELVGIHRKHASFCPENCHVRGGRPYQEIVELAREIDADLIVLSTRGHTGLKRVLLGSTAERVVRFASRPVLVVRRRGRNGRAAARTAAELHIRKILAPVDFSECSMAGAMYAAFLGKAFGAKLCLLHVVQPPAPILVDRVSVDLSSIDSLNLKNARLDMEAFGKLDFLRDIKCAMEVRTGYPVDQICSETKQNDVDLVVISTHGRTGFNRMLLGSVAEHVVRYAECPVMVVPSPPSSS
jgi:nucleotide-binding universal stress UspA family protein